MKDLMRYIPKELQLLTVLAVVLGVARMLIFGSTYFLYLFWNLFLAALPFSVSFILRAHTRKGRLTKALFVIGGVLWLLLLPNAPYVVTDLIHIGRGHGAPVLYDTFLLFSSAWFGLVLGFHSLSHIEEIIERMYNARSAHVASYVFIALASIGIYIGRYLRFNSWDVFTDSSFFGDTFRTLSHPTHFGEAVLFILPCFFFFFVSYKVWCSRKSNLAKAE